MTARSRVWGARKMAKHKVFVGVMYSDKYEEGDTCVMLVFPKNDKRYHEVLRPIMLEANNVYELRNKIQGELNVYLSSVYGYVNKENVQQMSSPPEPVTLVEVDSLTISEPGPAVSDPNKSQMLLDLGSIG